MSASQVPAVAALERPDPRRGALVVSITVPPRHPGGLELRVQVRALAREAPAVVGMLFQRERLRGNTEAWTAKTLRDLARALDRAAPKHRGAQRVACERAARLVRRAWRAHQVMVGEAGPPARPRGPQRVFVAQLNLGAQGA